MEEKKRNKKNDRKKQKEKERKQQKEKIDYAPKDKRHLTFCNNGIILHNVVASLLLSAIYLFDRFAQYFK